MIDLNNSNLILLLGGVAFFMFGMTTTSGALEKLLAQKIASLMKRLAKSPLLAIVVGILLTTILQSSGAVTSMLVGLGSAGVIQITHVMGVIIGTAIGSTLTVQLISFNLSQYALPLLIFGFGIYFVAKKNVIKQLALAIMGFAFLFLGMGLISTAAHNLSEVEFVQRELMQFRANPWFGFLFSMFFCAFVHSSAVTIGVAMSLASAGILSAGDALYWVYGANIGTTSIALIASINSNHIGKQVAWSHFFYKTLSVGLFMVAPVHQYFLNTLLSFETSPLRTIANAHFFYNLISSVIFYPFIKPGARMIEKLFPKNSKDDFTAEYLTMNNYQSTSLATSLAHREIMRTADIVMSMIQDSIKLFENADMTLIESIKERDNRVDYLYRETKMFLLDHANKSSAAVHQNIMNMIMFLTDLERAADSIDLNLLNLSIKKSALKLEFSGEGWDEIRNMHAQVLRVGLHSINSYNDREMCSQTIQLKRELAKTEITFRENHIGRLNRGLRESINTSSIHLDVLSEYKRIASLLCSHAYSHRDNV